MQLSRDDLTDMEIKGIARAIMTIAQRYYPKMPLAFERDVEMLIDHTLVLHPEDRLPDDMLPEFEHDLISRGPK